MKKDKQYDILAEITERIVIDYANLSGRESEYRAEFREKVAIQNCIEKTIAEFEKEFPQFRGVGAQHPIFNETPVYTHITQFIERALTNQLTALKEKIEGMECPEKCRSGNIFDGYIGERNNEESWSACPVCVKRDEYKPVVLKADILEVINK